MLCKKRWGSEWFSLRGPYYHIFTYSIQYYQIRIGSDPHNFAGSGSSQGMQPIDLNSKHMYFLLFHENFNMQSKIPVWRIRDVYPRSRILIFTHSRCRIPDLGSRIQKFSHNFLCSHKFHKIGNYFSFEVLKKKIGANFQRIKKLFTTKIVTKLSKIWVWDPGSEIRDQGVAFGSALFWCQSGIQTHIWIDIKMASLIRIRISIVLIKTMPLHNTDYYIYNTVPTYSTW